MLDNIGFQHVPKTQSMFPTPVFNNVQHYPNCFPVCELVAYKPWNRSFFPAISQNMFWTQPEIIENLVAAQRVKRFGLILERKLMFQRLVYYGP
jgi:hypothetical protein